MKEQDKQRILTNLEPLSQNIKLWLLENELVSQNVLSVANLSTIKKDHQDKEAATKEVLKRITTRGDDAYEKLIGCLLKTNHKVAAQILNPMLGFFERSGNPQVETKASIFYRNLLYNVYQMEDYPRGGALIISNIKFEPLKVKGQWKDMNRYGGEVDEGDIASLFDKFGFEVHKKRDLTGDGMRKALTEFAKEQIHANATIVVIMSHGGVSGILGVDHTSLPESEVFSIFHSKNSPNLKGKPKLFFIQACRGEAIKDVADSSGAPIPFLVPLYSHMKVCFSTCQDMEAYRNQTNGTWFISTLVKVFSKKAASTELDTMLKEVAMEINQRKNDDNTKQSVDIRGYGWDKDFYFNPGFYIKNS